MKIVSFEESLQYKTTIKRSRVANPKTIEFLSAVDRIPVGAAVVVQKDEWLCKNPPGVSCSKRLEKTGKKFKSMTLADKSGWIIRRVA